MWGIISVHWMKDKKIQTGAHAPPNLQNYVEYLIYLEDMVWKKNEI